MILRRNEAPIKFENGYTECLGKRQLRKKMNSYKSSRENWKRFKNCPYFCQTRVFCDWSESPTKSPGQVAKTLKDRILENFSKCFLRLEGLPARKSRAEPWKYLSNPHYKSPKMTREHATEACDLTYPRPSRQNRAKMDFWNFQIFSTKYFPKTPKTLKNLFVLELTKIKYVKTHFTKYNHTNDYDIYWT